jgi:hypothetical protein
VSSGGSPVATGLTFTTPALFATKTYYLAATGSGCESARVPVVVTVKSPYTRRINSGGANYTTGDGKLFVADANFSGGSVSSIPSGEVAGTTDDALYRNLRTGATFSYGIPSGNGTFDVILHFNETYFGYRTGGGAGSRRFNVNIEGVRKLTNYDVFAVAGGAMRAVKQTIRVVVSDGTLNLFFSKGASDNPAVAAIEVVPVTVAAREASETNAVGGAEDAQISLYCIPTRPATTSR